MVDNPPARRGEAGFTLVETFVVIAILCVLAAVVIFSVAGANEASQQSAGTTEASILRTAEEAHFATTNPHVYASADALVTKKLLLAGPNLVTVILVAGTPSSYTLAWATASPALCTTAIGLPATP